MSCSAPCSLTVQGKFARARAIRSVALIASLLLLALQLVQTIDFCCSFVRSCDTVLVCLPAASRVTSSATIAYV